MELQSPDFPEKFPSEIQETAIDTDSLDETIRYHLQPEMPNFAAKVKKPKKCLVQAVKQHDKSTVDEWIAYLESKPKYEERKKLVNQFSFDDDKNPFYNAVHLAVINNDVYTLEKLSEVGADVKQVTNEELGNPPLVLAAMKLSDEIFNEESVDGTDHSSEIKGFDKTTFHVLLQNNKVDVNCRNHAGVTPLHAACSRGKSHMVTELLQDKKIQINIKDKNDNTPLHAACTCGNKFVIESLIKAGADYTEVNDDGKHPLHIAVVARNLDAVTVILDHAKAANQANDLLQNKSGHSVFLLAVQSGDEQMVTFLLDKKIATVTDKSKGGLNCFHYAAAINKKNIMDKIFTYDPLNSVNLYDDAAKSMEDDTAESTLDTPLHSAARNDQVDALEFLIQKGANLEKKNHQGRTPLLVAAFCGSVACMELLIQHGADVAATDIDKSNIIHSIVLNEDYKKFMEALLDPRFCNAIKLIDAKDVHGQTPLHIACKNGLYKIAAELLDRGAKVTLKDDNGSAPLHLAADDGHLKVVQLLVDNYAEVDVINEATGMTPLTMAAAEGHANIVKYLLDKGADVDGKFTTKKYRWEDSTGTWNTTPLIIASNFDRLEVVKLLLDHGADVTHEDVGVDKGKVVSLPCNCLVVAIHNGHRDVALAIVNSDSWEAAMRWRAENDDYGRYSPMNLLIIHMPDVAQVVMDKCIIYEDEDDGGFSATYNYEFLDGNDDDIGERGWLIRKRFKKDAHALQTMVDKNRTELLKHPLAVKLLDYKWRSFGLYLYLLNLVSYLVYLTCLTVFALASPTPNSDECINNGNETQNSSISMDVDDCEANYGLFAVAIIVVMFSGTRYIIEGIQYYYLREEYLHEPENYFEGSLFVISIVFVSYGLQSGCQCPASWQWQLGAIALFLAWLNLILFLKKVPGHGVYVQMFVDILATFMRMILLTVLFVISFGLSFYMIFFRPGTRSSFSSPGRSLVKAAVMTTGELDFDGIFFNSQEDADDGNNLFYPHVAYFLWIVFIVMMPILLSNLLTGLAVDDIKGIQNKAALKRLALAVDLVLHIEEFAFIRNYFKKKREVWHYAACRDDQFLRRNQEYTRRKGNYSLWQKFMQPILGLNARLEDTESESSTEEVREEITKLKNVIEEINEKIDKVIADNKEFSEMIVNKLAKISEEVQLTLKHTLD